MRSMKRYRSKEVDISISVVSIDHLIAINMYKYSITLCYKAMSGANQLEVGQSIEIRGIVSYQNSEIKTST